MIKAATVVLGSVLVLVACPAGAQQPEQDILEPCVVVPKDLSGCVWALTLTVANLQGRNERLEERVDELEQLIHALGRDQQRLWNWSHCHGGQAECAQLQDRGIKKEGE